MNKRWKMPLMRIGMVCLWLIILSVFWSVAYFLMDYVYHSLDVDVHRWLQQIITSIVGILLFFFMVFIISLFNKKMVQRHELFFQSITDAIKQIATGDFNINIEKMEGHDNPNNHFGRIVDHINEMAKDLGQVEEMRQEFISNVSHEIQSPLTSISGFARALKNEQLTKRERERYLTIIETESQRLSNISDNLLKLTYLEAENHDFTLKTYRLDQQLQHTVLACEPQWQKKKIDMKLHMEQTWLTADEELMNQVWFNLISNAIKFTEAEGKISINIVEETTDITVIIADTGIGISKEEQMHLFERFYKADEARMRHKSGSGLGLSIVKKILTLHDASIQVESDETGTTFYITFLKQPANERS